MRLIQLLVCALALIGASPPLPRAQPNAPLGFAVTDLTKIEPWPSTAKCYPQPRPAEPKRFTYLCRNCGGLCAVDVLISNSNDGTEGRFRSGETSLAKMQSLCQAREPRCTLERLDANGAIGWVSRTIVLGNPMSTSILFRGGDVLTIRSLSDDPDMAYNNGKAVRDALVAIIIGTEQR